MTYYVVGGEYTSTEFRKIVPGKLEVHGPFKTYNEARDVWKGVAQRNVDDCHHRVSLACETNDGSRRVVPVGSELMYDLDEKILYEIYHCK